MTVEQLRARLRRAESDERLLQSEREIVRITTLGVLVKKPRTVGEAKRYLCALESALHKATTEVPM